MARSPFSSLEPLEARIAPAALTVLNPLPDVAAGWGKTGATVDLGYMFEDAGSHRTYVEFMTNFDIDPAPGLQPGRIVLELFDDTAPLTVQNFLLYLNNQNARGDYDGTLFHRAAFIDLDANGSAETPFVLQGGAIETSDLTTHIPTTHPVANEYDKDDLTRANLRGTIALAKSALGPNSGTSEFFFNLDDRNAEILNEQNNGGFTVFGRVVQGMDVVDAIAAKQRINLGAINGALSEVPTQNYNPNPDNNPNTPPPLPTSEQLIQITDAKVIPAQNGHSDGVTYSVTITDGNGKPSKVVSGKLNGDTLELAYKSGTSGAAKVTVTAQRGDEVVEDEFEVVVKPNVLASSATDTLPGILVPGNKGTAKVTLANTGAGTMNGKVDVKFYLSELNQFDPEGTILGNDDVEIGSLTGKAIKLGSGKSMTLSTKVTVPETLTLENGTQYRVIAQVITPEDSQAAELGDSNTVGADGFAHPFFTVSRSNLVAYTADSNLSGVIVPGDSGTGKVLLYNNTGQIAKGKVDVHFFLSHGDGTEPIPIGSTLGKKVTIPAGKVAVVSGGIQLPSELKYVQGGYYQIAAVVEPSAGSTLLEFYTDDNVTYDPSVHAVDYLFGTFDSYDANTGKTVKRKNVALTYIDADDTLVKASIGGAGQAKLHADANGNIEVLEIASTTAASKLTLKTSPDQRTSVGHIHVSDNQPLGSVAMGNVDVTGDIFFRGGVKSLTLGNIADPSGASHPFWIGEFATAPSTKADIRVGSVTDYEMISEMPINSLVVENWLDENDTVESILVSSMNSFVSQQNLEAPMAIMNPVKLQNFTVGGTLSNVQVHIFGDVGTIKLGAMKDSAIVVGSRPNGESRNAVLDSFTIRGAAGAPDLMANSILVSQRIGTVDIQSVDFDSGIDQNGQPREFGIVAQAIKSYNRGTFHLSNLTKQSGEAVTRFDQNASYSVRLV